MGKANSINEVADFVLVIISISYNCVSFVWFINYCIITVNKFFFNLFYNSFF